MIIIVNYRLALHEYIRPDDTMYGFGIVLAQRLIDMRHVEYYQPETFCGPAPHLQLILYRGLCKHPDTTRARSLGIGIIGRKVKMADTLEINTAVGGPGIENELPLYPIDLCLDEQVLGFRNFELDAFVSGFFEAVV